MQPTSAEWVFMTPHHALSERTLEPPRMLAPALSPYIPISQKIYYVNFIF